MTRFIKWINIALAGITLLSFLSPHFNPEKFWPAAILGLIFPVLVILNILFILFWAFRKDIFALVSVVTMIIGFTGVKGVINFGGKNSADGKELLVATYNIEGLIRLNPKSREYRKLSKNDMKAFFEEDKLPDIICFQEITTANRKTIQSIIDLPYFYHHTSLNTCIFSKYPITDSGSIVFKKSYNSAVWADVDVNGKKIRVFNFHLQSNSVKGLTDKTLSAAEMQARKKYSSIRKIFSRIKNATSLRVGQAKQVKALIRKSPYPVLVCGDMNDTSQSYVYATISDGLKDSFKESAFGFGSTYNGKLPFLRIDYIFASDEFSILTHKVERVMFSDHNPVFSTISIKKN